MLGFLLRYLQNGGESDWLGDENSPLKGFHWRGGAERDTTGIILWSKVFTIKMPNDGEEVAIILMDTQGTFDNQR